MQITEITEDNIERFEQNIDQDILENIQRKNFFGIAAHDVNNYLGSIIWELKYVDDIYNASESRLIYFYAKDNEVGNSLMDTFTQKLAEEDVGKTSFELSLDPDSEEVRVLKENGFEITEGENPDVIVDIDQLSELPIAKEQRNKANITSLTELSPRTFRRGIVDCMFHIQREVIEDLDELEYDWFEPHISCYEETDGDVSGYLLVHKTKSGMLRVELLADWGAESQTALLHMIRFSISKGKELYSGSDKVIIRRHDEITYKLVEYLFHGIKGDSCVKGVRTEEA